MSEILVLLLFIFYHACFVLFVQIDIRTMGENDECKLVIVARTDLQMGKGKIAAQVAVYMLW